MLRAPVKAGEIGVKSQKEDGLQSQDRRPSSSSIPFRPEPRPEPLVSIRRAYRGFP